MVQRAAVPEETWIAHGMELIGLQVEKEWAEKPELAPRRKSNPFSGYSIGHYIARHLAPDIHTPPAPATEFCTGVRIPKLTHPAVNLLAEAASEATGQEVTTNQILLFLTGDVLRTEVQRAMEDERTPRSERTRLKKVLADWQAFEAELGGESYRLRGPLETREYGTKKT
jgi:hypothetical protein